MNKSKIILLSAGGTGGHLFPAIALAEELQSRKCNPYLIADLRCKKYLTPDLGIDFNIIDVHFKTNNRLQKIKSYFKFLLGSIKALYLVIKIKPEVIVGFGGYPSFPALFAGLVLNIPIVIHEQNAFLGKTNQFFAKYAKLIALSYKTTQNLASNHKKKTYFIGNMIRNKIKQMKSKNNFTAKKFHILVFGGSQGAQIFNTLIPEAIKILLSLNPNITLSIAQQTSNTEKENLSKKYNKLNINYQLSEFFYKMDELYDDAHLVISRSGASTISELINIGLPAILIPYPYAMNDHQYFNASILDKNQSSWCFRQSEISPSILAHKINELILDRDLLKTASKNLLQYKHDGAKTLSDKILNDIITI